MKLCVCVCLCVLVYAEDPEYAFNWQSKDISAGPPNFKELFVS